MNRNMLRRIELAWPVTDPALRRRIIEECLEQYLADNADAWLLQPDGVYLRAHSGSGKSRAAAHSAQAQLMARYGGKT